MPDRQNPEAIFLEHLAWIERAAAGACRKHGVSGAEAEDFAASAKVKLMENDYAVLRRYRGESSIRTYLVAIVMRHFTDYWRERRGRWRPSAAAERLGPPAGELEALVRRDGYRVDQAGEKLRTAGRTSLTDGELARLLARIPPRAPLRPVEVAAEPALLSAEDPARADAGIAASEAETGRERMKAALRRAMERLEPEEQIIMRMRFQDGRTLADVARALRLEQKALYRRVDRLRDRLQEHLEDEGVSRTDFLELFGGEEAE